MDLLTPAAAGVTPTASAADAQREGASLRVTWLGHSSVVLDLDGVRLLTDPLLRRHAGPLRRRGRTPHPGDWANVDAVLLSHLHHDHAEVGSLRMLPEVPILTSVANAGWLHHKGLDGRGLHPDEWTTVGDVAIRLTPADHHARPMPHRPNDANGHLVRGARQSVWAVGDTSLYAAMADVPGWLGRPVDVVLVPIGGWGPRLSAGHVGPDEAAEVCRRSGARYAVPVHYGTLHPPGMEWPDGAPPDRLRRGRRGSGAGGLGWMDQPLVRFRDVLPQVAPGCELVALAPGDTRTFPVEVGGSAGSAAAR